MGKLLYTEVPEAITPAEGDIESIPLPVIITPSGKYSVINGVHDGDYVESLNCPAPYLQKKGSEERIEVASVAYGSGNDIELYFVDDDGVPLQAAVGEQYDLVILKGCIAVRTIRKTGRATSFQVLRTRKYVANTQLLNILSVRISRP